MRNRLTIVGIFGTLGIIILLASWLTRAHAGTVLIISPHPDDGVLCCAGVIQQALADGKRVHVVNITDGEGYRAAAALWFGKEDTDLTFADTEEFARIRREEDTRAYSVLGLSPSDITYLGYPDGFLDQVWDATESAVTSPYSGRKTTHGGMPYSRQPLLSDVGSLLSTISPRTIYFPDSADLALDHSVVSTIVSNILDTSKTSVELFSYVVHAQSPHQIGNEAARLTSQQTALKNRAISAYTTQHAADPDYLSSFVSDSEHFSSHQ